MKLRINYPVLSLFLICALVLSSGCSSDKIQKEASSVSDYKNYTGQVINRNIYDIKPHNVFGNVKRSEVIMPGENAPDLPFSSSFIMLDPKQKIPEYTNKGTEIYFVYEGAGLLKVDGIAYVLKKGRVILVPPNSKRSVDNDNKIELKFLLLNTPPYNEANVDVIGKIETAPAAPSEQSEMQKTADQSQKNMQKQDKEEKAQVEQDSTTQSSSNEFEKHMEYENLRNKDKVPPASSSDTPQEKSSNTPQKLKDINIDNLYGDDEAEPKEKSSTSKNPYSSENIDIDKMYDDMLKKGITNNKQTNQNELIKTNDPMLPENMKKMEDKINEQNKVSNELSEERMKADKTLNQLIEKDAEEGVGKNTPYSIPDLTKDLDKEVGYKSVQGKPVEEKKYKDEVFGNQKPSDKKDNPDAQNQNGKDKK